MRILVKAVHSVSPARKAAFQILREVEQGRAHSDVLLRTRAVNRLSAVDRNLATALVLGVLRWQILLDEQIKKFLTKPNARLDTDVLLTLRLGAFQLLQMERIPAHAAIGESVELTKLAGQHFAARMVNAVLRKLAAQGTASGRDLSRPKDAMEKEGASQAAEKPLPTGFVTGPDFSRADKPPGISGALAPEGRFSDSAMANMPFSAACSAAELALATAHPAWLVERWAANFGLETARVLCLHGQSQPAISLRIADAAVEAELAEAGIALAPGALLTAARTVLSGDVGATGAFGEGRVRMQDEGSQLVAELACASAHQSTRKIVDACAAPGGKTLILAERFPGAHIVACESSETRCEDLAKRLASLGQRIECRNADAATLGEESAFDLALVDVPCSGTGTLGRNPEIRHRLQPEELARQAERQRAILAATLRALRPGGRLVYSTCSLEPEENEQVVAAVLAANPSARQLSLSPSIDALHAANILAPTAAESLHAALTLEGALRLLPGTHPTDGFFVALLEKIV